MPGANPTNNYIGSFQFRVTIEGINDPLDGFTKVSPITSTTENIDFKHGLDRSVRKAPGRTSFDDITLERVYSGLDEFSQWRERIVNGELDRRTVAIEFLGPISVAAWRIWAFIAGVTSLADIGFSPGTARLTAKC